MTAGIAPSFRVIEHQFDRIETAPGSGGTLTRSLTIHQGLVDWRATVNGTQDPLIVARFWSKIDVRRPGECWPWRAKSIGKGGHGLFRPSKDIRLLKAHRFAWEVVNGPIQEGRILRHRCDNAPCCNPAHLILGTQAANIADMHMRKRRRYRTLLSDEQIAAIRDRYLAGETQKALADEVGCTPSYISMIIRGVRGASVQKGIRDGK